MTTTTKRALSLAAAQALALRLEDLLRDDCARICVAGSVRRGADRIGDLELVAIPKLTTERDGLFSTREVSALWRRVEDLRAQAGVRIERHPPIATATGVRQAPWGDRYRKLLFEEVPVDLFTATPETWGHILLIRTGPADFSQAYVTALREQGLASRDGQVVDAAGAVVPTPREEDAFAAAGWRWRAPGARR